MLEISNFICVFLYFIVYCYLFCNLICQKKFELKISTIIICFIATILQSIIMNIKIEYLRPYIMHIISFITLQILYKQKVLKTLLGILFLFITVTISEILFGMVLVLLFKVNFSIANSNALVHLLSNISILVIMINITKFKKVRNIIISIINWYNDNELKSLLIFVIFTFIIGTFFLYNNFVSQLPKELLWITNLFFIAVFTFIIGFFKEKTNKNKLVYEYDQLLDYVKTYEQLLDEKSKNQHEYKNQLAVIKLMCNNKKTMNYIDSLLNNETEENLDTLNKLMYIPKGGLKGLIYYKIELMKKNKINVFINVSKELSNKNIWKRCDSNLEEVTKILGVYLDNAIEAASDTLDKIITLDIYLDNKDIIFEISNTFINEIDVSKIDNEGFTTKGDGKGYGLALVKDILKNNNYLEQEREINGNYYVQKLIIKK